MTIVEGVGPVEIEKEVESDYSRGWRSSGNREGGGK